MNVIPLRLCENYNDAEKNFEETANEFVKTQTNPSHPIKIIKDIRFTDYSANVFVSMLKTDSSFPFGIAFVRKNHEAFVYEKICYPGTVYNSYVVKYLGRIDVLMQNIPGMISETEQKVKLDRMKDIIDFQEAKIMKLEAEIKRLEYTNTILENSKSDRENSIQRTALPIKPNDITLKKEDNAPVLKEIKERFSNGDFRPSSLRGTKYKKQNKCCRASLCDTKEEDALMAYFKNDKELNTLIMEIEAMACEIK